LDTVQAPNKTKEVNNKTSVTEKVSRKDTRYWYW